MRALARSIAPTPPVRQGFGPFVALIFAGLLVWAVSMPFWASHYEAVTLYCPVSKAIAESYGVWGTLPTRAPSGVEVDCAPDQSHGFRPMQVRLTSISGKHAYATVYWDEMELPTVHDRVALERRPEGWSVVEKRKLKEIHPREDLRVTKRFSDWTLWEASPP